MRISVIGTGYVGLVTGTCFSEMGHSVTCIDINREKIRTLMKGESPIYEPGLTELLKRNIRSERLTFSTEFSSISTSKVVFLAVGTPSDQKGKADLSFLMGALDMLAEVIVDNVIVVIKSTVPLGTWESVKRNLTAKTNKRFHIVSNPEFLKEGSAIDDFMRPDRVVIGCESDEALAVMEELYAPLVRQGNPVYQMSNLSAELTKYAANCFLATKISFINEMANLCDEIGADIEEVRKGIISDKRIGPHFLYPGPGYGGSCFPKDVKALMISARERDFPLHIVEATDRVNENQKTLLFRKIIQHFAGNLQGKTICFWGVSFKPNTDDIRESAAIDMAKEIAGAGARIHFHDPVAAENFIQYMNLPPQALVSFKDMYECLKEADALVVITDWAQFKSPDFSLMKSLLKSPLIFDGRNLFNTEKVLSEGFQYFAIGKRIGERND